MGTCRVCGAEKEGVQFFDWVKETFTNYDLLHPGDIVCSDCLFWFDQHSVILQRIMGKDKPQKMQNYSHFIKNGEWLPVSKGDKRRMAELILTPPFPELAAIAVSGQKHIAFRARRNVPGQQAGWVQFEETPVFVSPPELLRLMTVIEALYAAFSKDEIASGKYSHARILQYGADQWWMLEEQIQSVRNTALFDLALFLAKRSNDDDGE